MLIVPFVVLAIAAAPDPSAAGVDLARLARLSDTPGVDRARPAEPVGERAEYPVESASRSTLVYALPAGPRTVRALEIVPDPATVSAWRSARVRLTWDSDDPDPALAAVDLPLVLAFGRCDDPSAWVNRLPMPYRNRALLRIDTEAPLVGRIRVGSTQAVDPDAGYLRGAVWDASRRLKGSGRGHIVGAIPELSTELGSIMGLLTVGEEVRPILNSNGPRSFWRLDDPVGFREGFMIEPPRRHDDAAPATQAVKGAVFWYSEQPREIRPGR